MADELQNNGQQTLNDSSHDTEAIDVAGLRAALRKGGNKGIFNKGVCSTAAGTAAKTVTVGSAFALEEDALVLVRFANEVTSENSTLSVNNSTAKPIYYHGEALEPNVIKADSEYIMRYDGSYWCIIGGMADREVEVEIGETSPLEDVKLFVDTTADPSVSIDVYTRQQTDTMLAAKSDKTATVSSVSYDSNSNMLRQTINGVTTDITPVVQSGIVPLFKATTGIMELDSVGGATIAPNSTTGIIEMTF